MSLTAKQNIHITTDNNLAITTNKDLSLATTSKYNLTVQNGIRVFVQTGGIKHYTAKDDIELQAQDGQIKHIAKDNIEIISTEGKIQITSPTQLSINICGSEFKMNEQGVFITTPGVFQVKSNEKVMEGGEEVLTELPSFPTTGIYSRRFDFGQLFDAEELKRGIKYKLINHSKNTSTTGILDELGRTARVFGNDKDEIEAVIMGHDNSDELIMYEIQNDFNTTNLDDVVCCACESESLELKPIDDNLNTEDSLEEDYNDFGN
ncbi:DUF2345 domain-containing protein [Moraxella bovis]|nr:DUF2345 domain-containing protein [Moraxella bovis]UYZ68217.1 DUF2345 domain-containing protein [Moraxella bovis]UYZ73480.1 DUF2345 domain-containing protein [Moraxella bovis]UZA27746.1 DUF2345 domain-containing protein [Moraxella bovis]UZA37715.1 DUF2345 domain-containing protein [Moraxella bovis]UZA43368.1 DUF2345 domain-containing protein [Moraxella bovis]